MLIITVFCRVLSETKGMSIIMKTKVPHTFALLFIIIIIMSILTYIVPAGEFDRIEDPNTGRTVVAPNSDEILYHFLIYSCLCQRE